MPAASAISRYDNPWALSASSRRSRGASPRAAARNCSSGSPRSSAGGPTASAPLSHDNHRRRNNQAVAGEIGGHREQPRAQVGPITAAGDMLHQPDERRLHGIFGILGDAAGPVQTGRAPRHVARTAWRPALTLGQAQCHSEHGRGVSKRPRVEGRLPQGAVSRPWPGARRYNADPPPL